MQGTSTLSETLMFKMSETPFVLHSS